MNINLEYDRREEYLFLHMGTRRNIFRLAYVSM